MSRQHCNRLIAAGEVAKNLEPVGSKPDSERQARPLTRLEPEEQASAWEEAVETAPARNLALTFAGEWNILRALNPVGSNAGKDDER